MPRENVSNDCWEQATSANIWYISLDSSKAHFMQPVTWSDIENTVHVLYNAVLDDLQIYLYHATSRRFDENITAAQ